MVAVVFQQVVLVGFVLLTEPGQENSEYLLVAELAHRSRHAITALLLVLNQLQDLVGDWDGAAERVGPTASRVGPEETSALHSCVPLVADLECSNL